MKSIAVTACCCLVLLACRPASCGPRPPFYDDILRQCDVRDQESLDRCLYDVLNSIRPFLRDGIPEWHMPVMEPLAIQGISFNQGGGNTRIRASFNDLKVAGLSNYTITYVKSDPNQYKFSVGLQFPKLHIKGDYDISGSLLVIPIQGRGPFKADFEDVKADSYNWLEVQRPAALPERLHLSHTQTDFDVGKANLRLERLFDGDEFLGEAVNNFLNENAHEIIREVKPHFAQEIDRLVVRVFSEAIAALPVDTWEGLKRLPKGGAASESTTRASHRPHGPTSEGGSKQNSPSDDDLERRNSLDKNPAA